VRVERWGSVWSDGEVRVERWEVRVERFAVRLQRVRRVSGRFGG
jgi:hypothetical protein